MALLFNKKVIIIAKYLDYLDVLSKNDSLLS